MDFNDDLSDVEMETLNDSIKDEKEKDEYEYLTNDAKTPGEILDEFCATLQDTQPTIPDPVILHYMKKAGFIANDPKLVKIVSLASQKFISEIVSDCMQYHKLKTNNRSASIINGAGNTSGNNATNSSNKKAAQQQQQQATLTLDDLSHVLQDYGINVKKPYYFL